MRQKELDVGEHVADIGTGVGSQEGMQHTLEAHIAGLSSVEAREDAEVAKTESGFPLFLKCTKELPYGTGRCGGGRLRRIGESTTNVEQESSCLLVLLVYYSGKDGCRLVSEGNQVHD